jgi:acetoacetyl-CoA synthetase
MWPYMLSGLACGSRIILYDGSPLYPDVKTYLRLIDEQKYAKSFSFNTTSTDASHRITHFGTSPRFLSEVQARGVLPRRKCPPPLLCRVIEP